MSNLIALYLNNYIHFRLVQHEFPPIPSQQILGSSMVTLKYLLNLKKNRRGTLLLKGAKQWCHVQSRRDTTKITRGKNCTDLNVSQYFKLWAASL